ncbi:MAG: hypothetical protein KDJ65_14445 [Anaerolineae bacterium]|nr:hypothetical protein [Anaerolineae bacterium]
MAKFVRPTIDTKFYIDFSWWQQKGQNLRAFLLSHANACPDCQRWAEDAQDKTFDWISPETGEVYEIDMLWHVIRTYCKDDPNFLDNRIPLTTAIFRVFILNNNTPISPAELHQQIPKKSADMILRTIGRRQIYKGIKPFVPSV